MAPSPEAANYRHVLLFRISKFCEMPLTSTETSLYRSELTGNYVIEQIMIGLDKTTTATVVLSAETMQQLIPFFQGIPRE